ncbi:hypothetical protein [Parasphingorhabdus sp.]|uniref:hypothetical protein n=1 Tax=Parasphingorhabdus sp. TaxID=2709688 RepID=UPI0030019327
MPKLSLHPESANATAENWNNAQAALKRAMADLDALGDNASNEMLDGYSSAQLSWLEIVMGMAAPDHAALAEKLRLFKLHDCRALIEEIVNPMLDAMREDAERLGGLV